MKKILFSLICAFAMSMTAFAATETTVYYAIPDATVGTYTVKLNVCLEWNKPDPNQEPIAVWQQFDMQKTDKTFNANPIYKVTFTDKWDGANTMQFQLYDGEQWKSQEVAFDGSSNGEWTTADTYNGKMRVFGTDGWQAYQEDGAVTPDPVKFYIVGNTNLMGEGKDWKLEEAIKVTEDSYTFKNLAAGDYELKVLTALDWGKALGYTALSEKSEGLAAGENDNVTFTLAQAGDVVVTYIAGDPTTYTVKGNFYVPASDTYNTLRFVPNKWAEADAKIAAWIWGEKLDGQFTSFFAGEGDTLTVQINAKADSIIFVRFNSKLAEPKWNTKEETDNEWNRIEKMKINTESLVYTITDWAAGTWDVYTPETPAKFYIVGNEALMGEGKDWKLENAVKVTEDTYTFKNLAAGDYALKVLTALDWGKALGYGALSEKTEGLAAGENDNVTFTLAQAGDVVVTYIAGDPTTYTVKGNFYVPASDTYNTLRFVPNKWAEADAKIAAWIWGEKLDGQFTSFFAGEGDTLTVQINAKADSIIFVRFNSKLAEPKWNTKEETDNEWNRIEKMKINTESLVYTITDWAAGTWDVFTRVDYILNNAGELANEGAKIFVHTWGDGMADEDILMTEVKDGEAVVAYKAAINDLTQYLVFVRMYPEAEAIVWEGENKYWNKSDDLARCVGNQAYFTGWEGDIFKVSCDEPTGFETIEQDVENGKVIYDGVLYIIRDGKRYNAQGVEVK